MPDRTMKHIQIEYSGMRPIVQQAVCMTNQLLRDIRFYERIATLPQFDMADVPPAELARLMYKTDIKVEVELYYAISPVQNIDLYADDAHPNILQLNIWTLNRPVASICNTLLHGCVHAVNAVHNQYYFGHGDNDPAGKERTAPYLIGALGEELIAGATYDLHLEHDNNRHTPASAQELLRYCA